MIHAAELVTCRGHGETPEESLGLIEDGAIGVDGGKVSWVGTTEEFNRKGIKARKTVDASGKLVTPGFVDPHTHLVYAGSREDELERKVAGESYASILASGGGIMRTLKETRSASSERIARESSDRLRQLLRNGVTTAEVKTGYGQSVDGELKMLEAIRLLKETSKVELVPTFLGLHATPPEYKRGSDYVDFAIRRLIPAVSSAETRCAFSDCFCEEGVFSREECKRYLRASKEAGFGLKIHADEFAESGGASLAAELGCTSADHLGRSDPSGFGSMAAKGVSAVLLPGTSLSSFIPYADARTIIRAGCNVALGTDLSPNSWIESPQLVMSLACSGMKLTPAEALLGFTRNAATAIGRQDLGTLTEGSSADIVVHSVPSYRFLPYRIGGQYVESVFRKGEVVFGSR